MAKIRKSAKHSVPARNDANVVTFPGAGAAFASTGETRFLPTVHGPVTVDLADPCAPVARADLSVGTFAVGDTPMGIEVGFDWSETTESFAIAFSSKQIAWATDGRRIPTDTVFSAITAIQDALAILIHEEPRVAALAKSRMLSRRLEAMDAELAISSDPSRAAIRAELAERAVAARRGLFADVAKILNFRAAA